MPELQDITQEIAKTARDAAYVVVGLGVLGFQRAQVRRQELAKRFAEPRGQFGDRLGDVRHGFVSQFEQVDSAVERFITRLETSLEPLGDRLPPQARDAVKQAQAQAREARQQLRERLSAA